MTLRQAILATLAYSDHFGFPLTLPELQTRLIQFPVTHPILTRSLSALIQSGSIFFTRGYYHLPGRAKLVAQRLSRAKLSAPLIARAHNLAASLSVVPGVLAIYLTGSLAMQNTPGDADIDLMIITQPGHLWTTRLLLTPYTHLHGLRRTPHSINNSGKLCLNLYLSPSSFCLPPPKRSLYSAYELIQAVPLYDPHNTHSALLAANPWVKSYLPNYLLPKVSLLQNWNSAKLQNFWAPIESLAYHLQLAYMRPHLTREYITIDSAFFHPHNPGEKILHKLSL